jgi:hypothetical protein
VRIYIPQHLKKLGIFRDLGRMVEEYEKTYQNPTSSFTDYQNYMKIDPVLRFVSFCIKQEDGQTDEEYMAILNYVTRLFYSVRGTRRVLDYVGRYLGIKFIGNPIYTVKTISFSIANQTEWYDVSLFNSYLLDFLSTLLYYESISYKVDLNLEIIETKEAYLGVGIKTYKLYKIGS